MLTVISGKLNKHNKHEFSSTQFPAARDAGKQIRKWGNDNISDDLIYTDPDDPTLGRERDMHVTIKFGLHTGNVEEVKKAVKGFGSFEVSLDEVSKFSSGDFDVIKVDVKSRKLHALHKLISDKLKCTDKYPVYKPHLTIAYVKKGSCDKLLGSNEFADTKWTVDSIYFSGKDTSEKEPISL